MLRRGQWKRFNLDDVPHILGVMQGEGAVIEPGLSDSEFDAIELRHGFTFPPDLRQFLSQGLPVGRMDRFLRPGWFGGSAGWLDWRNADNVEQMLDWPLTCILDDVKDGTYWFKGWGDKPTDKAEATERAYKALQVAPRLVPLYGHRFIPDRPNRPGNPVFSIYGTDIIQYGADLVAYFECEVPDRGGGVLHSGNDRRIDFWTQMVEQQNCELEDEQDEPQVLDT